jgi:glycosyltransferase involved in cell wall biosynthesis
MVPQDDADALAEAITMLLSNPHLQDKLRREGLKTAQRHTWQAISKQLEAHFQLLA